jgi:hypothetical protein
VTATHNARIFAVRMDEHRAALVEAARQAMADQKEQQQTSRGRWTDNRPFYAKLEAVLHAAGCVEVRCMYKLPGVVQVRAEGMLLSLGTRNATPLPLRDDQVCEIVQQAERVLKAAGGFRTHVAWDRDPPVLYVGRVPTLIGFGL